MQSELEPLNLQTFSIRHEVADDRVIVTLKGNADSDVAAPFAHYLDRLHQFAVKAKSREVLLDFRELYFLTSSCIKCLVVFIKRDMAMDARAQYRIRLATTPALRWQERSFEVLCQLAPMLVTISPD
jgi:hypothetical protein